MRRALIYGLLASLFFAFTFLFNRSMNFSGEVLFTLIGGICFLGDALPSVSGFVGIAIIVAGMILNSFSAE